MQVLRHIRADGGCRGRACGQRGRGSEATRRPLKRDPGREGDGELTERVIKVVGGHLHAERPLSATSAMSSRAI